MTVGRIVISDGIPNLAPSPLFDGLIVRVELEICKFPPWTRFWPPEQISNKSFVGPGFLEISIKTVISSRGSCPAITKQVELCFNHLAKENLVHQYCKGRGLNFFKGLLYPTTLVVIITVKITFIIISWKLQLTHFIHSQSLKEECLQSLKNNWVAQIWKKFVDFYRSELKNSTNL